MALLGLWGCAEAASGAGAGGEADASQDTGQGDDGLDMSDVADEPDATPPPEDSGDFCQEGTTRCLDEQTNLLCEPGGQRETAFACPEETRCREGVCQRPECEPGARRCATARAAAVCDDDGLAETITQCGAEEICAEGACVARRCEPGATRCLDGLTALRCDELGAAEVVEACAQGQVCLDGACLEQTCEPGAVRCADQTTVARCQSDGQGEEATACGDGEICFEGACAEQVCEPDARRCLDVQTVLICDGQGLAEAPMSCPDNSLCQSGSCVAQVCEPGTIRCGDANTVLTCNELGTEEEATGCGDGVCRDGVCAPRICTPGTTRCEDLLTLLTCDVDGTVELPSQCPAETVCDQDRCRQTVCEPGTTRCDGFLTVLSCQEPGLSELPADCPDGQICEEGRCVFGCVPGERRCTDQTVEQCAEDARTWLAAEFCDPQEGFACRFDQCVFDCENIANKERYIGCDFWAVDAPQDSGALSLPFGIRVGNPDRVQTANVRVVDPDGVVIHEEDVSPGSTMLYESPVPRPLHISEPGISRRALRVVTDVPVVAHQFSPVEARRGNVIMGSAEASLMLPTSALGSSYMVPSWQGPGGFVSVVSAADNNVITITPTARIEPIGDLPLMEIDVPVEVTLDLGEVMVIQPDGELEDLTGTMIESSEPVAVYSGHSCASVPTNCPFCDHLQEAVPPMTTWGTQYVTAAGLRRGQVYSDTFRIIASEDNTTLTFDPPLFEQGDPRLDPIDRSYFIEFSTVRSFTVTASAPVLLVQYFKGSTCTSLQLGDPSMIIVPPVRQWLEDYTFETPESFANQAIVIGRQDGTIRSNRVTLSFADGEQIGDSEFWLLRAELEPGRQNVDGSEPFQALVYGHAINASYGFCAGLDLSAQSP